MNSLLQRTVRATGLSGRDSRAAESLLGRDHPFTRALAAMNSSAYHVVGASGVGLLGLVGVGLGGRMAILVLTVSAFVGAACGLGWMYSRALVRRRTWDLIAAGEDAIVLGVVARERRRLASQKERRRLAGSLELLLRDARRWEQIAPQWRPLPGVECLRTLAPEVASVVSLLRADHVHVQGVALVKRLLTDGSTSPLYSGDVELLRDELNRIAFLLEGSSTRADTQLTERAAA